MASPGRRDRRERALRRQVARLDRRTAALEARHARLVRARQVVAGVGGLGALGAGYVNPAIGWAAAALFLLGFIALVRVHRRLHRALQRHRHLRALKAEHLDRMGLDWDGLPPAFAPDAPLDEHPFAADLHVTGPRSLHRLLNTAVTTGGGKRLADWLLAPEPDVGALEKRHALVRALRPLGSFRDRLRLEARLAAGGRPALWNGARLLASLRGPTETRGLAALLALLLGLAGANAGLWALHALGLVPGYWVYSLLAYVALYGLQQRRLNPLLREASALERALDPIVAAFRHLETRRWRGQPDLSALCAPFVEAGQRPSAQLKRLARVTGAVSLRNSGLAWLLVNLAVPWDLFFLRRFERCKAELAEHLPDWLDRWYELEALGSLAQFAYLNPQATFPVLESSDAGGAPFRARGLGHPLIREADKVRNDVALHHPGELALVTGSNMSGKSTLLRAVGANLCLSDAGAPVDAYELRARPCRLFTCIQVSDSLSHGISYFYAEVKRLKALLDALERDHPFPLLFLVDEIFCGTNNRERLIGSRAYLRALAGRRGVGLISTHDLELVSLEGELSGLKNYHFRETIEDGRMRFDYRLRPGPCPTTNALEIMRLEGLPVEA